MRFAAFLTAATLLATPTFAAGKPHKQAAAKGVKSTETTQKVTFTNKLVNGKKTWLPAKVSVTHGDKVVATVVNTLKEPHGFAIDGVVPPVVVGPGETKTLEFTAPAKGSYKVKCQLHPGHVGSELDVQ